MRGAGAGPGGSGWDGSSEACLGLGRPRSSLHFPVGRESASGRKFTSAEALPEPPAAWAPFAASGRFLGRGRGLSDAVSVGQSNPERAPATRPHAGRSQQPRRRLQLEASAGSPSAVDCGPSAALGAGTGAGPGRRGPQRPGRCAHARSAPSARPSAAGGHGCFLPVLTSSQQCSVPARSRQCPGAPGENPGAGLVAAGRALEQVRALQ